MRWFILFLVLFLVLFLGGCGAAAGTPAPGHSEFHCFGDRTPRAQPRSMCARSAAACGEALAGARQTSPTDDFTACAVHSGAFCYADQRRREHCAVTEDDCELERKATDIMLMACQER